MDIEKLTKVVMSIEDIKNAIEFYIKSMYMQRIKGNIKFNYEFVPGCDGYQERTSDSHELKSVSFEVE